MIDLVRVCHACSPEINELMKTGTVEVAETDQKWETLKASGKTWKEILDTISLGHMALLRNLRGIFTEIDDLDLCKKLMEQLKRGVKNGKQFPFRYKTAMDMIDNSNVNHKQLILDTLEECIDIAAEDMPKLSGKTICLSDNSGSARHTFNSEFGRVTIANIDNLSSVITARNSDEGYVGVQNPNDFIGKTIVLENEDKRSFFSILTPRVVKVELTLKELANEEADVSK